VPTPIALADSLYFGDFEREHSRYLMEGVVEGISHYGNCIGVPTVTGSTAFHGDYEGNPLVNVACIGLIGDPERMVTAGAQEPGNKLVLVGNSTGRDNLGGASFASGDLAEDAETEDRPAVQVGDPYTEKLLIRANEQLVDGDLIESARDLGAAGLGGAKFQMVAKARLGADIELSNVHDREPNMNAIEYLLAESQERMCYEVEPDNVDRVGEVADRFDLGCSVIGEVTDGNYRCTFEGETVVDVDAYFLGEGAPMNDLPMVEPATQGATCRRTSTLRTCSRASSAVPTPPQALGLPPVRPRSPGPDIDPPQGTTRGARDQRSEHGAGVLLRRRPQLDRRRAVRGARAVALENATNVAAKGPNRWQPSTASTAATREARGVRRVQRHRRRPGGHVLDARRPRRRRQRLAVQRLRRRPHPADADARARGDEAGVRGAADGPLW